MKICGCPRCREREQAVELQKSARITAQFLAIVEPMIDEFPSGATFEVQGHEFTVGEVLEAANMPYDWDKDGI